MPDRPMKIALVSPPISLEARYGKLAGSGSSMPSLGLLSLAAVARKAGFEAHIIEAPALGLSFGEVMERLAAIRPDIVGLTATTLSIFNAHETARGVKEAMPEAVTVVGGPHVSAAPILTLERFPSFDIAVLGEGEATLIELMEALSEGRDVSAVAGLAVRTDGKAVLTAPRPFIKDLDTLPLPAWDLMPGFPAAFKPAPFRYRQLPAAILVSSRGCPNRCIFCDRTVFGRACRFFSADYVMSLIKELHDRYGVKELEFEDDTFVVNKPRVMDICDRLKSSGWGMSWSCLGRVDMVNPELLKAMKAAGCWQISYGIESGDQGILDLVEKKIKLERAREALAWTKEAGMMTKGFFIMGFPTETIATMQKTIDFAKKEALDDISVFKLTPLPGSKIYDMARDYGTFDDDWRKMNLLDTVFVPNGLTKEDLDDACRRMLKEFYLRPSIIASYMLRLAKKPSHLADLLRGFSAFVKTVSAK